MADWLVILGEGEISYQGTWADFKQDPKLVLKLDIGETHHRVNDMQPEFDKAVQSKSLKVAEAANDLSRATGDVSLYGNVPETTTPEIVHRGTDIDLPLQDITSEQWALATLACCLRSPFPVHSSLPSHITGCSSGRRRLSLKRGSM